MSGVVRTCGECGYRLILVEVRHHRGGGSHSYRVQAWGADNTVGHGRPACRNIDGLGRTPAEAWADYDEQVRHTTEGCSDCEVIDGCDCAHCVHGHLCKGER